MSSDVSAQCLLSVSAVDRLSCGGNQPRKNLDLPYDHVVVLISPTFSGLRQANLSCRLLFRALPRKSMSANDDSTDRQPIGLTIGPCFSTTFSSLPDLLEVY